MIRDARIVIVWCSGSNGTSGLCKVNMDTGEIFDIKKHRSILDRDVLVFIVLDDKWYTAHDKDKNQNMKDGEFWYRLSTSIAEEWRDGIPEKARTIQTMF